LSERSVLWDGRPLNVDPHEIAHVLARLGHVKERNLLAGSEYLLAPILTPELCQQIHSSPYVKPIGPASKE
ncbi:MAG TPA: hypothetical protein VFV50_15980, partial [Bdellovibrionales bacterium]|nr:hypothetical protein [Bdellovibrionales bacterium]